MQSFTDILYTFSFERNFFITPEPSKVTPSYQRWFLTNVFLIVENSFKRIFGLWGFWHQSSCYMCKKNWLQELPKNPHTRYNFLRDLCSNAPVFDTSFARLASYSAFCWQRRHVSPIYVQTHFGQMLLISKDGWPYISLTLSILKSLDRQSLTNADKLLSVIDSPIVFSWWIFPDISWRNFPIGGTCISESTIESSTLVFLFLFTEVTVCIKEGSSSTLVSLLSHKGKFEQILCHSSFW